MFRLEYASSGWISAVVLAGLLAIVPGRDLLAQDASPELIAFPIPPLIDQLDGRPVGPGAELAVELAKAAGLDTTITVMPLARALRRAESHGSILVMAARTADREDRFTWIAPVYEDGQSFATVRPTARIDTLEAAKSLRSIGVRNESTSEMFLRRSGFAGVIERSPEAADSARKLAAGRIDAWFVATSMIRDVWRKAKLDPSSLQIGTPVAPSVYWMAAAKSVPPTVVAALRTKLAALRADGTYERIFGTRYLE